MKLNVSYPANGSQKIIEVDDERKLRPFMEKRMGSEVSSHLFSPLVFHIWPFVCVYEKEEKDVVYTTDQDGHITTQRIYWLTVAG